MKNIGCGLGVPSRTAGVSPAGICRFGVEVAGRAPSVRSRVGVGAVGILALALTACGGGGSSTPSNSGSPPPPPAQYSIGGSVSGLTGTGLVLQDNGGDNLAVSGTSFTFATKVNSGGAYAVTVLTQPSGQNCTVTNGSGTATANVTNVMVSCASSSSNVTIGGAVSGLAGTGLVLQDNGGDNLSVTANGSFTFKTALATGKPYAVTVATQPTAPAQTCTVTNGTGTTGSSNVTNVTVSCITSAGKFAYTANNGDNTISAYTIKSDGTLMSAGSPTPDGTAPAAVSLAPNGKFAYSASDNGTKIQAFTIDQSTGALTLVASYSTGFSVGSTYPDIAVDAQSAHLYLASAGDNEVAAFSIDPSTGALTELNSGHPYPAGAGASAIPAFSPDGKFLYVMDTSANAVSGYVIGSDGSLTPMSSTFPTGAGPTWISFTPDGKFAYVSNTNASNAGTNSISAYSVNDTTGALTPLPTPTFPADEHPEDLTIDATGTHLYAPMGNGSSAGEVEAYTINADGTLTVVGTTPAGVIPVFLDIEPTGHFAYVASKAGAEVYGYSIDPSTGALTKLPKSPYSTGAGSLPQFITIDPSGKFGYTANEGTANISEFALDPNTGDLNSIGTAPAGLKPIFVSISPEAPGIRD
jgi:6-phosphogluconolactonase (cycloisomerase 2 family)